MSNEADDTRGSWSQPDRDQTTWSGPDFRSPDEPEVVSGPVIDGSGPQAAGAGWSTRAEDWRQPQRPGPVFTIRRPARTGRPIVTQVIIAICAVVWLAEMISPAVGNAVYLSPALGRLEPWRFVTSAFAHSDASLLDGLLHIGFNMFALWMLGPAMERFLGHAKFAAVYGLSILGADACFVAFVGADNASTGVVGASGAIFGLFGALLLIGRSMGGNLQPLLATLLLNAVIMFMLPGIAWQAHLGGFVTGVICGWLCTRLRRPAQSRQLWASLAGVAVVLIGCLAIIYAMA